MRKLFFLILLISLSCKKDNSAEEAISSVVPDTLEVEFAKGFSLLDYKDYKILKITNFREKDSVSYTYLLRKSTAKPPKNIAFNQQLKIPVEKLILTSTSQVPFIELLGKEEALIGFPNPDYISSPKIRARIDQHKIADLGENESLNTEMVISLQPDALIGFSVDQPHPVYRLLEQSGIPVVFNNEWKEGDPLGKAEWIKFFGALFDTEEKADSIFAEIKANYLEVQKKGREVTQRPRVFTGALYKDVWHVPGGKSWAAQFIEDAGGDYLFKNSTQTGSLALSFESVLDRAQKADIWLNPSYYTSYDEMKKASSHYEKFEAFQKKKVYTYAATKGVTGGILFFELGPSRPDLVLKDLLFLFHPELLTEYQPTFYQAVQ